MADDFVQVAPNSTGAKIDNSSLVVGANTVMRQRTTLGSNNSPTTFAAIFPAGRLQVSEEPTQLFYDPFDGGLIDASARWSVANAGGGVAAAIVGSALTLGTGTTANGYSSITSQNTFGYPSPSWLGTSAAIQIENPVIANSYRFFGFGTSPGTPTAAAPLTDAVGFEVATDGKMYAVMYQNGTRLVIQDLSAATGNAKQPTDGAYHRWILYCRIDRIYWCIDSIEVPVAFTTFTIPNSQLLPIKSLAIAGATPPASSAVLTNAGWSVWDTGRNNTQLSDGAFPHRKATVKAASTAALATDTAIVVAPHPSSVGVVKQAVAPTSALTTATVTTSSTSILAANANRRGASVYVESGSTLHLALSGSASLTAYTVQVAVGNYYEVPANYSGALFGIAATGSAVCRVTEFT